MWSNFDAILLNTSNSAGSKCPGRTFGHRQRCGVMRQPRFVHAAATQCVVNIRDRNQPRDEWDAFARQPVRVSGAVPSLVVTPRDVDGDVQKPGRERMLTSHFAQVSAPMVVCVCISNRSLASSGPGLFKM